MLVFMIIQIKVILYLQLHEPLDIQREQHEIILKLLGHACFVDLYHFAILSYLRSSLKFTALSPSFKLIQLRFKRAKPTIVSHFQQVDHQPQSCQRRIRPACSKRAALLF